MGIAMRSPLNPLLDDIFMAKLEHTVLESEIERLRLYDRGVDVTFIV